ncbi:4Fe-4S single cluster domain-containing protein [Priestia megaterium]|uniref:4Fe-4S single cluster domain-containing protein n=1 Tax=Priestia megaterium TaxID=1404 RepID=UPI0034D59D4A
MELRIHRFLPLTQVEGPGKRACIWVQGCSIHCKGCGVPWTWSKMGGKVVKIEELYEEIIKSQKENQIEGVTFMGGEPFDQAVSLAELGKQLKAVGLSVMTFSGYTIENLKEVNREGWSNLLSVTDLFIDGPFVKERLDLSRPWVGSSNQRYHFLTDRYINLKNELSEIPNRIEVRLENNGEIRINGMATQETLQMFMQDIAQKINR